MFDHQRYKRPSYFVVTEDYPDWVYYSSGNEAPRGRYKLHIGFDPNIPLDDLKKIQGDLHNLLHASIDKDLVTQYKTYNVKYVTDVLKQHKETAPERMERQLNNSFVIYLLDSNDDKYLHDIAQLIYNIEKLLVNVKTTGIKAECDLRIASHVVFRQAYLDSDTTKSDYVRAIPKDPNNQKEVSGAKQLKIEGERSHHYLQISAEYAKMNLEEQIAPLKTEFSRKVERLVQALTTCHSLLSIENNRLTEKYSAENEKVKIISKKIEELEQQINQFRKNIESSVAEEFKSYDDAETRLKEVTTSLEQQAMNGMKFSSENVNTLFSHQGKAKKISEALYLTSDTQTNLVEIAEKLEKDIKSNPF